MKTHDCIQGSVEWHALRLGKPTSSEFKKIIRQVNLKDSKSRDAYASQLATELVTGEVSMSGSSGFMERGRDLEDEALRWYRFHKDVDTTSVGFITDDKGLYGCSPDDLVGEVGIVEIKNPAAVTHGLYIDDPDKLVAKYRLQWNGLLWVTKREWLDLVSYNPTPEMKNVVVRCLPEQEVFDALDREMPKFLDLIETKRQQQLNKPAEVPLSEMGYK